MTIEGAEFEFELKLFNLYTQSYQGWAGEAIYFSQRRVIVHTMIEAMRQAEESALQGETRNARQR